MNQYNQAEEIEKAKINYSPVWRISNEVFKKTACDVLGTDLHNTEIKRHVGSGCNWGKLGVYVYSKGSSQTFYALSIGDKEYFPLSSNIDEFKKGLKEMNEGGTYYIVKKIIE